MIFSPYYEDYFPEVKCYRSDVVERIKKNQVNVDGIVFCFGLCNLDLIMEVPSYPVENSRQRCMSYQWQRGGNATNSAVIFTEYGRKCEFIGALSSDTVGRFLKKDLEDHQISLQYCRIYDDYESPMSTVLMNMDMNNRFRTAVNSNPKYEPQFHYENFVNLDFKNCSWMHFECRPNYDRMFKNIDVVRSWNENKENNYIPVSIEIEQPHPTAFHKVENVAGSGQFEVFHYGDVIFISNEVAKGYGYVNQLLAVESLSRHLRKGAVIISSYDRFGAYAKVKQGPLYYVRSQPCPQKEIINTFGAGDTFIAATIMSLLEGQNVEDSIQNGCNIATTKCRMHDTKGLSKLCPITIKEISL